VRANKLIRAVIGGNYDEVKRLIETGCDVNAQGKHRSTALMRAMWKGQIDIVKLLIDKGADVNAQTKSGHTALMTASHYGHTEVVKLLIKAGADVNARSKLGFTALMRASTYRHTEVAKLLIKEGANVNAKTNKGSTALMSASFGYHREIAKLLKEAGAKELTDKSQDFPKRQGIFEKTISEAKVQSLESTTEGDSYSLQSLLQDSKDDPDFIVMRKYLREKTSEMLQILSEKERRVLMYRYCTINGKKYTLEDIGEILDISPETVRQIEMKALIKIREHFSHLFKKL